eukprot:gnl/Hemi2/24101_TR8085_c0_g1_i1.p1 gnl/Hemi2/24101_TR8085_c0_g1~~gnl/Hemi2/24101_TR8085_c0_g1_i1.p1  ORF type:complete len:234 (+),score=41.35 gnl/Hemi2/24101_TR8085_c0_g1_i1:120-821(+)
MSFGRASRTPSASVLPTFPAGHGPSTASRPRPSSAAATSDVDRRQEEAPPSVARDTTIHEEALRICRCNTSIILQIRLAMTADDMAGRYKSTRVAREAEEEIHFQQIRAFCRYREKIQQQEKYKWEKEKKVSKKHDEETKQQAVSRFYREQMRMLDEKIKEETQAKAIAERNQKIALQALERETREKIKLQVEKQVLKMASRNEKRDFKRTFALKKQMDEDYAGMYHNDGRLV